MVLAPITVNDSWKRLEAFWINGLGLTLNVQYFQDWFFSFISKTLTFEDAQQYEKEVHDNRDDCEVN